MYACVWGLDGGGVDRMVESVGVTAHAPFSGYMGMSVVRVLRVIVLSDDWLEKQKQR